MLTSPCAAIHRYAVRSVAGWLLGVACWGAIPGVFAQTPNIAPQAPLPDAESMHWANVSALALRSNLDLRDGQLQLQAAQVDLAIAGLRPNPSLSLSDTGWRAQQGPLHRMASQSAALTQLIERGNKRELRTQVAQASLSASRLEYLDSERAVLERLLQALVDLHLAQHNEQAASENLAAFERSFVLARKRLASGDLSALEAGRIETDALRARNDLAQSTLVTAQARQALALILGVPRTSPWLLLPVPIESLPQVQSFSPDEVLNTVAVRAAVERQSQAQAALELTRAQRTRDISLGLQMDRPGGNNGSLLGFGVSFPLFVFNDLSNDVRRSALGVESAKIELQRVQQQSMAQLNDLRGQWLMAQEWERRLRDEALPLALRNTQSAEFAFARGAYSTLDVLDAQRTLRSVQLEVFQAQADRLKAAGSLALAQQTRYRAN
jgi:outer membrane protein, heavy metal efflux system